MFLIIFLSLLFGHNLYCQTEPTEEQKKDTSSYYSDPFSEIETTEDEEYEESLERFYSYGRILHISGFANLTTILGPMQDIYRRGVIGGVKISYFIDWDVAITFHFSLGKFGLDMPNLEPSTSAAIPSLTGGAIYGNIGLGLKYYINFYDISKPISYINPAIFAGVEMSVIRDWLDDGIIGTQSEPGPLFGKMEDPAHRTVAPGMFIGTSIEFPIFRKSIYLGLEFIYHMTFFPADNPYLVDDANFNQLDYSGYLMSFGMQLIWSL